MTGCIKRRSTSKKITFGGGSEGLVGGKARERGDWIGSIFSNYIILNIKQ